MKRAICTLSLWFVAFATFAGPLPDVSLTPGVINSAVTQANISTTICVAGWTKTVRPPVAITNRMKAASMAAYGIPAADMRKVEYDHLLSLEDGGAPADPKNLWPEYLYLNVDGVDQGARQKDKAETATKRAVCSGKITLDEARHQLMTDWRALYFRFVAPQFPKYTEHKTGA